MHDLPYLNRGRLSIANCPIPDCTAELLASATDYENPPSEFTIPQSKEDYERPRRYLGLNMFRKGIVPEFLLRGLVRCGDREGEAGLRLPEKGSVTEEAIDDISKSRLRISIPTFLPLFNTIILQGQPTGL